MSSYTLVLSNWMCYLVICCMNTTSMLLSLIKATTLDTFIYTSTLFWWNFCNDDTNCLALLFDYSGSRFSTSVVLKRYFNQAR